MIMTKKNNGNVLSDGTVYYRFKSKVSSATLRGEKNLHTEPSPYEIICTNV